MKRFERGQQDVIGGLLVLVLIVLVISAGIGIVAFEQVPEGHQGVQKQWGAVTGKTYEPGLHMVIPIMQGIQPVEFRPREYSMVGARGEGEKAARNDAVEVLTADGLEVRIDTTIRYNVKKTNADEFVVQWDSVSQVEERLIRPAVRDRLRTEGGNIETDEIYTKDGQERLRGAVREVLEREFEGSGLNLIRVHIRRVHLPPDYADAVNQKEVARQEAQQVQYHIQKAEAEKERRIVEAEAAKQERVIAAEAEAEADVTKAEARAEAIRMVRSEIDGQYNDYLFVRGLDETDTIYFMSGDAQSNRPYLVKNVDDAGSNGDATPSSDDAETELSPSGYTDPAVTQTTPTDNTAQNTTASAEG